MRFMMLVKATPDSETGRLPTEAELTEMGKYNEELVKAGILLAGEGLHPSSKGARVTFSKTGNTVTDGPFSETKELVSGFWIIEVKSREEAIAWARRVPFKDGQVEIRQVASAEDFAPSDPTGELRAKEDALRAQVEAKAKA
ncbi:YciI family protein [Corallococcus macrosporus]|uniref:YciI family protein n=1 Tax=Corallococcus macrosporus TaxID=35 RepID=A0ABS3DKU7_9BACT|nr:YciI family protein [Corallococcus macrosporus]MBN8231908.1 YciI family protein [Corallococcus macrosporus]